MLDGAKSEGDLATRSSPSAIPALRDALLRSPDKLAAYEALCRELESERARLAAIVEGSRDAIWSWRLDGRIATWNAEAERIFGYSSQEIIGKSLLVLVPKDRHEAASQVIAKLGQGSWYGQYETVRLHKNGKPISVELTVSPTRGPDGLVMGASTVCRDITSRKEIQTAMTKRLGEVTTLSHLAEELQAAQSPDDIYRAALRAIADALGCQRSSILLFDVSQKMRFAAWSGLSETYRQAVDGHSPWTPAVQDPQPIYVEDVQCSDLPDALKDTVQKEGINALAFIPLTANGRLIGKFMTYYAAPHFFTDHEKVLAVTIARQLALAVSRCQSEEELRASEQRFRLMSEHAPVMIWMSDAQGKCLHLNRMLRTFWGVDDSKIAEFDWSKTMHPGDAERVGAAMWEALQQHKNVSVKGRYTNAHGHYRVLQTDARPRFSVTGEFVGMIGVNVDITERDDAEKALRESEQRFRSAVEAAPSGMIMTNSDGRIVLCNAYAEKLFGYTRTEMVGQHVEMLVPDRFRARHPDHRRLFSGNPSARFIGIGRDLFARRKDGTEFPVEIGLSPFHTNEGLMVLAAVVDISDRKKAEAHRELLIAELNHRVKNTLSTVQSLALQTLKGVSDRGAVKALEARLVALSSAHDVLTRENWESAGLREVVEQAVSPHRSEADGRFLIEGPEVRLGPKSALALAMGLHELCTNAAKYGALSTPTGSVSITWSIDHSGLPAQMRLQWQERGGPPVLVPQRKGFGTLLVQKLLASDLDGTVALSYPSDGVICSIVAPVHDAGGPFPLNAQ